ncbi:MAG: ATP-binding protein [Synechococcus sp.]
MFSFTAIDITESKQTVETLVASEARYRSVLEALTEYVHCCSPDYKFTFANHAYCQFRQKSSDELIGIGIFDDVSPEDRELVRKHFDSLTLEKPIAVGENRTVSPEGQVHWHQWIDRAIFNERGKLVEIQSVGRDITDRKRSEETLKLLNSELEQRTSELQKALEFDALLKRIIDQMRDSLDESQILNVVVRELGQALGAEYCNTALYDNGKIIFESLHEYSRSKAPINLIQIALADFPRAYYQVLQGKNACFCWAQQSAVQQPQSRYSVLVSPIVDDRGVLGNLRIFKQADRIYEPSELRLVEQVSTHCAIAIRQARLFQAAQAQVQELERLNIMKDDFLSTVSHELRTPITSMKMAIQMLKVSDSEEKRQRYLAALESECQREANLVNDLLDLQRLQSGASPLEITEINLQAWIPKLVKSFTPRIEQRQQQLDITINPSIAPLRTDEKSLHRILAELVNNACKYTPDGGSISVVADTSVDSWGLISVSNSGAEISPAEIERIFDKFYRIPSGDPWKQGGTGLGLALIAQLVDHLGGSIEVCSEDGQVTFSVRLPSNK